MMMQQQDEPIGPSLGEPTLNSTQKKVRFEMVSGPQIIVPDKVEKVKAPAFQGNRLHQKSARTLNAVTAKNQGNSRNTE